MSLQSRLGDLITAVGTDVKQLRTWLTGSSSGDLTGLTTTSKTSIVSAINEVNAAVGGSLDTDPTLAANSDAKIATQKAVKAYADNLLDANNAYQYKGGIDCSANPNYPAASAGWSYKVTVAGKIGGASGVVVEVGDTATCLVDSTASGNQATVGSSWLITQTNIDGAVVGPASSTAGDLVTFSGTSGKVIQDSSVVISTDGTMASNSDTKLSTEKAVRTYLGANFYTQTLLGNYDTDLAALYATAKT